MACSSCLARCLALSTFSRSHSRIFWVSTSPSSRLISSSFWRACSLKASIWPCICSLRCCSISRASSSVLLVTSFCWASMSLISSISSETCLSSSLNPDGCISANSLSMSDSIESTSWSIFSSIAIAWSMSPFSSASMSLSIELDTSSAFLAISLGSKASRLTCSVGRSWACWDIFCAISFIRSRSRCNCRMISWRSAGSLVSLYFCISSLSRSFAA